MYSIIFCSIYYSDNVYFNIYYIKVQKQHLGNCTIVNTSTVFFYVLCINPLFIKRIALWKCQVRIPKALHQLMLACRLSFFNTTGPESALMDANVVFYVNAVCCVLESSISFIPPFHHPKTSGCHSLFFFLALTHIASAHAQTHL